MARALQAFLVSVLTLADQAVTDIGSVNGILDTVSAILAVDVDPTGIAADVTVRAHAAAWLRFEVASQQLFAGVHDYATHL